MAQNHWRDTLNPIIFCLLDPTRNPKQDAAQLSLDDQSIAANTILELSLPQPAPGEKTTEATSVVASRQYQVQAATLDLLLQETPSTATLIQGARIILKLTLTSCSSSTSTPTEIALHTYLVWDTTQSPPRAASAPYSILDTDTPLVPVLQRASRIPVNPSSSTTKSLRRTYHAYIAAINSSAALPNYTHAFIRYNGVEFDRQRYQRLMGDAQDAIADLTFTVGDEDILVDEARQMVGARIRFHGRARTPWEERAVEFGEVVFYWFVEGKIREVVSVVDMEAYRAQAGE